MKNDINDIVGVFVNWLKISGCDSFRSERGPNGMYYLTPFNTVTKHLVREKEMLATEEEFHKIKKATTKQLYAVCLYFDPSIKDASHIIRGISLALNIAANESIGLYMKSTFEGTVRLKIGCHEVTNTLYHQLIELSVPVTFEPFEK
ncbi:MAG: hypothetical protein WC976_06555 [Caldisericia bacterium]